MTPAFLHFLILIAIRTLIVGIFLMVGFRVMGKRQIGQINVFDLAMIMAIANAVQNAMTNGAGDLLVGIVSSGTLITLGWTLSRIFVHLPKVERYVVGAPTVLISKGKIIDIHLAKERVTIEQLRQAMRMHGLSEPNQVSLAMLEVDGSISVVPSEDEDAAG